MRRFSRSNKVPQANPRIMASDKLAERKPNSGFKPNLLGIFVAFVIVAVAGSVVVYSLSDWTAPPKAIGLGMSTYQDRCQNCHGGNGNGRESAPRSYRSPRLISQTGTP